jgi:transposase-like protein
MKYLEQGFTESIKHFIRVLVKTTVKEEMEGIREEHNHLVFNGYYQRTMLSSFGKVDGIPIPRYRQGFGDNTPQGLQVFAQEQEQFMQLIEQMHLLGISTRKIKLLSEKCFGITLSKNRVGKVYQELAHQEEVNINSQAITDEFVYLLLDGIWEKTKGYGWEDKKSVLLCALGVRADGTRKVLGFQLAREESTESWGVLVTNLKERGLQGKTLQLVICDDHSSIKGAVERTYRTVPLQVCICHKMRNVLQKTTFKNKRAMAEDLKIIFQSQTKEEATEQAKEVCKKWYTTEQKAIQSLRYNLEYCFTYFKFPKDDWVKIRTTNILEREFREVRRRIKVFDNTFQNKSSANGYANSIFNYLNNHYPAHLHTKS